MRFINKPRKVFRDLEVNDEFEADGDLFKVIPRVGREAHFNAIRLNATRGDLSLYFFEQSHPVRLVSGEFREDES